MLYIRALCQPPLERSADVMGRHQPRGGADPITLHIVYYGTKQKYPKLGASKSRSKQVSDEVPNGISPARLCGINKEKEWRDVLKTSHF